jgi:hypothetical protein
MFQNQEHLAIAGEIGTPGSESMAALLLYSTTVRSIDLTNAVIGADGAALIADTLLLNVLVSTVRFHAYDVPIEALKGLGERELIESFDMSSRRLEIEDAVVVGRLLACNTDCTKLNVSNNIPFGKEGAEFVKHISFALRTNKTLVSLSVANNEIGEIGAGYIADALQDNHTLTSLDVSCNNPHGVTPTATGAGEFGKQVARVLNGCSSLTSVDISGNNLTSTLTSTSDPDARNEGILALAEAVKSHRFVWGVQCVVCSYWVYSV